MFSCARSASLSKKSTRIVLLEMVLHNFGIDNREYFATSLLTTDENSYVNDVLLDWLAAVEHRKAGGFCAGIEGKTCATAYSTISPRFTSVGLIWFRDSSC